MRVLIEVPTYDGRISRATSESLWRLDRCGHEVDYRPRAGYGVAMARNRMAADALNAGYDRLLMVDDDIEVPPDALRNLLEHDADVALGWYLNRYSRGGGRLACLFKAGYYSWEMHEASELLAMRDAGGRAIRVRGGGLGCALLKPALFERLRYPWFEWTDIAYQRQNAPDAYGLAEAFDAGGEDVNFCLRLAEAGMPVLADVRVACGHEFREVRWPS